MKQLYLILMLCMFLFKLNAQSVVQISGQIKNAGPEAVIYLGLEEYLLPLQLTEDGSFSVEETIEHTPSFFHLANISKRGKIEPLTPHIWFENPQIEVVIDLADQSFQMENTMPFQSISEKIEALDGNQQLALILEHPNNLPSLYFADLNKEKFSGVDLESYYKSLDEAHKNTKYAKRIENHLSAINKPNLKKGMAVENFKLPNRNNAYVDVVNKNGKPQVLALFSSGCAYSIASINLLEQLAQLNNGKIEIVTIWNDKSKQTWLNSYKEEKSNITWTDLWDEYGFAGTYFNLSSWPTFYVLNAKGELTQILKGYDKKTAKALKKLVE